MGMDRRFTPFVDGHIIPQPVHQQARLALLDLWPGVPASNTVHLHLLMVALHRCMFNCEIYIHVPPSASRVQCAYHQAENRA